MEIFEGSLIFENVGGFGQITRGTGADLGSFISEGFTMRSKSASAPPARIMMVTIMSRPSIIR